MQKRKRTVAALIAAGVLLGLSNPAAAVPIQVTAGGFFFEPASPLVTDGAEWSLELIYESSTLDTTAGLVTEGLYSAYQSLQLSIGDQLYSLGDFETNRSYVQIFNDRTANGGISYRDTMRFAGGIAGTTLNFNLIAAFGYPQPGGGPLSSDELLSDPAQVTSLFNDRQDPGWEFTDFIFFDLQPGQTGTATFAVGTVDRFSATAQSVSVPEPGTLSLLSLGLLMLLLSESMRGSNRRMAIVRSVVTGIRLTMAHWLARLATR